MLYFYFWSAYEHLSLCLSPVGSSMDSEGTSEGYTSKSNTDPEKNQQVCLTRPPTRLLH